MGDSQRPKPAAPRFEVPDLELEAVPRPPRAQVAAASTPHATTIDNGAQHSSDDALGLDGPTIDLGVGEPRYGAVNFGAGQSFDALGDMELQGNAHSGFAVEADDPPRAARRGSAPGAAPVDVAAEWPTGQAPLRDRLAFDPLEISLLAGYGEPPTNAYAAPKYAYRVFTRQREIKRALRPLDAAREQAEGEREAALVELARAVRPEAERLEQFRRLLTPLLELEQLASARGQALSSVNAELTAQASALDAELARIADQLVAERAREADAQHLCDDRKATMKRVEAKLKRVHIEMRAVTQVAEQKLGPQGGSIPELEATQLTALKERAAALEPELSQAKADFAQAQLALDHASARVGTASQGERLAGRKKQALVQHYEREIRARGRGVSESERAERAALADLGRAVLAARGAVPVPEARREHAKITSTRADALLFRCELHLRALDAYDRARAAQGVRLAGTLVATVVFLLALKLAL